MADDATVARMQALIQGWEAASDQRAIFLSCYRMMTGNMRVAIERGEFRDPAWVDRLAGAGVAQCGAAAGGGGGGETGAADTRDAG